MFKNLKISLKITMLSVILMAFCAVIGLTGFLFTKQSSSNLDSIYHIDLKAITLTDDMRLQARTTQYAISRYILTADVEEKEKLYKEIGDKINNIKKDIDEYKLLNVPDELQNEMLLIEENYNNFVNFQADFKNAVDNSSEQALTTYVLNQGTALDEFRSKANALMKVHLENTNTTYTAIEQSNKQSIELMLIILIVAISLGLILTFFIVSPILKSLRTAINELNVIATGDFSKDIENNALKSKDEVGDMLRAVAMMKSSIRETLKTVIHESEIIEKLIESTDQKMDKLFLEIEDVSATTQQLSAGMEETAASTEEMNAVSVEIQNAILGIAEKAEETAKNSQQISERANNVKSYAISSKQTADEIYLSTNKRLRDAIDESKAVEQINALLDAILAITSQTNLLALNAAIEAARAGEAGKGFAVVADVIRSLAENSGSTVNQIQDVTKIVLNSVDNLKGSSEEILNFIDQNVVQDYKSMVDTGEQYNTDAQGFYHMSNTFRESATKVGELMNSMVASIQEITHASSEGAGGTSNIAVKTSNVADMVVEITNQTHEMKSSVNLLSNNVNKFQI